MRSERVFEVMVSIIMLTIGSIIAAFALEEFLIPNLILDGGINGVSIILGNLTKIPISAFVIILNIPFLIIGYRHLGKSFTIKAIYSMIVFAGFLLAFEGTEILTRDTVLAFVFGGIILGIGVGIVIRFGGCLDGTETVAILISKKSNFSVGQIVLMCNVVIYAIAGLLFGWDRALYSLLTYFITFKIIDMVVDGIDQLKAVTIITKHAVEISEDIYHKLGRTVTFIEGEGLINGKTMVLYTVVTRLELSEIRNIIDQDDRQAFVTVTEVSEVIRKPY